MNILLVYPAKHDENGKTIKYKQAFLPPLTLAILDALTPETHNVEIINDIVEEIDFSKNYDLVGITTMTTQVARAYEIADTFRSKQVKVVLGGMHPTVLPEEAIQHADTVVVGEADNIWPKLLEDAENNCLKEIYKDDTLPDLQSLVIPKWGQREYEHLSKTCLAKVSQDANIHDARLPLWVRILFSDQVFWKKIQNEAC